MEISGMTEIKTAKKGDILQFDGKVWKPVSIKLLQDSLVKRIEALEQDKLSHAGKINSYALKISEMQDTLVSMQTQIAKIQDDMIAFLRTEGGLK